MIISAGSAPSPYFLSYLSARYFRRGRYPGVVVYWSAAWPSSARTLAAASEISWIGKWAELGIPPANEMISGFSVTLKISVINDLWTRPILRANEPLISRFLAEDVW